MLRLAVLAVLFAAVCAIPINDDSKSGDHDVIVVDEIDDYLAENPEFELFERLEAGEIQNDGELEHKEYKFGKRVEGDRLVYRRTLNPPKHQPSDYKSKFDFPVGGGEVATVSYVEITVDQTSKIGQAIIVSGGIGKRQISLLVEAKQTEIFKLSVKIYGHGY